MYGIEKRNVQTEKLLTGDNLSFVTQNKNQNFFDGNWPFFRIVYSISFTSLFFCFAFPNHLRHNYDKKTQENT